MGSGISTKYGKTYFYRLKEDEPPAVSEKSYEYSYQDTHTIESHNDDEVIMFCEDMISRKPYKDSSYFQNLANTAQHFEMNPNGTFGKPSRGTNVYVIQSENPMNSAMSFYSELSEGGVCSYTPNRHGIITSLGDGKSVLFRPYPTTEGSPVVEIATQTGKLFQKYHFIPR